MFQVAQVIAAANTTTNTTTNTTAVSPTIALIIGILSIMVGFIMGIITNFVSLKNAKAKNVVDTLSSQRIEWLNKLRKAFSDFNELVYTLHRTDNIRKRDNLKIKLMTQESYIQLLLNPIGITEAALLRRLDSLKKKVVNDIVNVQLFKDIEYLQQVILKAEWRRIVIETETGKIREQAKVNEIFEEKAIAINKEYAKRILTFKEDDTERFWSESDLSNSSKMKKPIFNTYENGEVDILREKNDIDNKIGLNIEGMYYFVYAWLAKSNAGLTKKQKNKLRRLLK